MAKLLISKKSKGLETLKKSQSRKTKTIRKKSFPKKIKKVSKWHAVPLKGSFMVTAILGFLLSYYYVYEPSPNFGIACMIIFISMFIASLVSMAKAPLIEKI